MRTLLFVALLGLTASAHASPSAADCDGPFQRVLKAVPAAAAKPEARAVWLDGTRLRWPAAPADGAFRLWHSAAGQIVALPGQRVGGADGALVLAAVADPKPERFKWVPDGPVLQLPQAAQDRLASLHRGQLVLTLEDAQGRVQQATGVQAAGALDDLYAAAASLPDLGAQPAARSTRFKLWAPTAQAVALCLYRGGDVQAHPLSWQRRTGAWSASLTGNLSGLTYTYLVDVFVPGVGLVRNRVTDPYSLSLNADSRRSWIGRLDAPALAPEGWRETPRPGAHLAATDLVVYELHLRDFSVSDASVPAEHRGKYAAFTQADSRGMQHLKRLAAAGLTDVHLLPVFDFASVPETGCTSASPSGAPNEDSQQAAVMAQAATDCFNWGYDPLHFAAPEGSYASNAEDGAVRILEFRRMVQALHRAGLRVGMDVVYNHMSASGQAEKSVLDRIVPGYYLRLDATGRVANSTCCANTATEHRMMAKLMIDSAVVWARDHGIDSFRFDLMGHQPREAMERLQRAVDQASGRHIHLIGEGWNFGEIANGARFVQAAQGSLNGSGIGSFSDRGRDAARGGGCCDNAQQTAERQGWLNGLFYDPNPHALAAAERPTREQLLRSADLVRVALAGTLQSYPLLTHTGAVKPLAEIDYAGQRAGFASQPSEVVNYVENHDNQTLFDIDALKLPPSTSREDRARVQVLGLALTSFSQGMAYFHAGVELLRSKSGDRDSFDSGDWFNRLDWTYSDNHWGSGLPPRTTSEGFWPLLKPLLADPAIKPTPREIAFTRDAFTDLLTIRASSSAFRLRSAAEVQQRLTLLNTGPDQVPTLMVGHLDARGLAGGGFSELLYLVNVSPQPTTLTLPTLRGRAFVLHPVHRAAGASDPRPARDARWDPSTATLTVPPRTAMVYVLD